MAACLPEQFMYTGQGRRAGEVVLGETGSAENAQRARSVLGLAGV
jgi:hypothetical protein